MAVSPVPETFHTVTPYLVVSDAATLLDFLVRAFDAKPQHVMRGPDGTVGHADVVIGDSHIMMGQARPGTPAMPAMLYFYLPDCDAAYARAITAGGVSVAEPKTQFYGDRHGAVSDSNGNQYWLATHVEDVAPDELAKRSQQAHG